MNGMLIVLQLATAVTSLTASLVILAREVIRFITEMLGIRRE